LNLAALKGEMFKNMESVKLGGSKNYLTESLIQFDINWIIGDDNSPLTQQFHVVPMVVASVVTHNGSKETSNQLLRGRFWINIAEATGVHWTRS
jgi:hypothetical protein